MTIRTGVSEELLHDTVRRIVEMACLKRTICPAVPEARRSTHKESLCE
jgi:hypothetical protein